MKISILLLLLLVVSFGITPIFATSELSLTTDMDTYEPGDRVEISGDTKNDQLVSLQVKDPTGKFLLVRTITADDAGSYSLGFKIPKTAIHGDYSITASISRDMIPLIETISISVQDKIVESTESTIMSTESDTPIAVTDTPTTIDDSVCGAGTIMKNGKCVVDSGGGCLIATATYGSELAPQVQQLREIRDNSLLTTTSGIQFMSTFNDVYYSFSPVIADYERENPMFKEMVKIAITPMVSSLSILNYVDMDSESSVLGYGISLIILNGLMYVGIPASVIVGIKRKG